MDPIHVKVLLSISVFYLFLFVNPRGDPGDRGPYGERVIKVKRERELRVTEAGLIWD